MSAGDRLRARLDALKDAPPPKCVLSPRELIQFILDHVDLEALLPDGRARCVVELPEDVFEELCAFDSDEREIDDDIEALA